MFNTVVGVLLIIMAVFLVISVLMQSSKDHRLSGSIAGGAETFFGKTKGKTLDALFNKLTTVIAIVFVVLVLVLYCTQDNFNKTEVVTDPAPQQIEVTPNADSEEADAPEAPVVEEDNSDVAPGPEADGAEDTASESEEAGDETADTAVDETNEQ